MDLCEELADYLEDGTNFRMLRHPLMFRVPYFEYENESLNQIFEMKKKAVSDMLAGDEYSHYIAMHERPYRVHALHAIMIEKGNGLDENKFRRLVLDTWIDSENIWQNNDLWSEILEEYPPILGDDDTKAMANLPDEIKVYRGTVDGLPLGWSWTIDPEKAAMFSKYHRRDGEVPVVVEGVVRKADVLFYTNAREEDEVVIDPAYVRIT